MTADGTTGAAPADRPPVDAAAGDPATGDGRPARSGGLIGRLAGLDSGRVMTALFKATLAGALALVAVDAWTLAVDRPGWGTPGPPGPVPGRETETGRPAPGDQVRPYRPALRPAVPGGGGPSVPVAGGLTIELMPATADRPATLLARGTLDAGAADRLAAVDAEHGGTAQVLRLDSPGGLVHEGLAAGRWARDRGLATEVVADAQCASSCPLVLAGGVDRRVDARAWVGVHQMFRDDRAVAPVDATMRSTQEMTAEVMRHFVDLGVSAEIMEPAMRTPPVAIYLFTPDELTALGLATEVTGLP